MGLICFLYSSETYHYMKALKRLYQVCLKKILNIKWQSETPDTIVLQQANTSNVGMLLLHNQMHLAWHLTRIEDIGYSSRCSTERLEQGKDISKKHYEDVVKNNLRVLRIVVKDWEQGTVNQSTSKKVIYESCKAFEYSNMKQALQKQNFISVPDTLQLEHVCNIYSRVCFTTVNEISWQQTILFL